MLAGGFFHGSPSKAVQVGKMTNGNGVSALIDGERYGLRFDWRWDELPEVSGSRRWTGFGISVERRLVDGQIGINYEWQRDEKGAWLDETIGLSWTLHSDILP